MERVAQSRPTRNEVETMLRDILRLMPSFESTILYIANYDENLLTKDTRGNFEGGKEVARIRGQFLWPTVYVLTRDEYIHAVGLHLEVADGEAQLVKKGETAYLVCGKASYVLKPLTLDSALAILLNRNLVKPVCDHVDPFLYEIMGRALRMSVSFLKDLEKHYTSSLLGVSISENYLSFASITDGNITFKAEFFNILDDVLPYCCVGEFCTSNLGKIMEVATLARTDKENLAKMINILHEVLKKSKRLLPASCIIAKASLRI